MSSTGMSSTSPSQNDMASLSPLREWRLSNHLSQQDAAYVLGLSLSTIRQVEAGLFKNLPVAMLDIVDFTQNYYNQYRRVCRDLFAIEFAGQPFFEPFPDWIESLGFKSLNSFCNAIKIRPRVVQKYYDGESIIPDELVEALQEVDLYHE